MEKERKPRSSRWMWRCLMYVSNEVTKLQHEMDSLRHHLKSKRGRKNPDDPSSEPKRRGSKIIYCDSSSDVGSHLKSKHGRKDPDDRSSEPKRRGSKIIYCDSSNDVGGSQDKEVKGKKKEHGGKGKRSAQKRKWKETFDEEEEIDSTVEVPPSKYPDEYCDGCGLKVE